MKDIFVTRPSLPPLEDFIPLLDEIWNSGILTNSGPFHQALEKALCEYLGVQYISLFCNGTIALITALQALGIRGEVITTPFSFVATSNALIWNGLTPAFVDIDKTTLNIDPALIEAAITPHTRAIMPVHCYGQACDTDEIDRIARKHNLKVIYDAAHAFAVKQPNGSSLLNKGDLSVLSFHATKVFNTLEGGAIISHDAETKQHIDQLKNFGFVNETMVNISGINGKMSEINAAFGTLQLHHIDKVLSQRKRVANAYAQALRNTPGILLVLDPDQTVTNHSYFPIRVTAAYRLSRDQLYDALKAEHIFSRRYFYPLISEFPMFEAMPTASPLALPNATQAAQEIICLPIYERLDETEISHICSIIKSNA